MRSRSRSMTTKTRSKFSERLHLGRPAAETTRSKKGCWRNLLSDVSAQHCTPSLWNSSRQVRRWRPDDNTPSFQPRTHDQPRKQARAGALVSHHLAWMWHHTGGSPSTPTVHPCPPRWGGCGWHQQHSAIACQCLTEPKQQNLTTFLKFLNFLIFDFECSFCLTLT